MCFLASSYLSMKPSPRPQVSCTLPPTTAQPWPVVFLVSDFSKARTVAPSSAAARMAQQPESPTPTTMTSASTSSSTMSSEISGSAGSQEL